MANWNELQNAYDEACKVTKKAERKFMLADNKYAPDDVRVVKARAELEAAQTAERAALRALAQLC